MIVPWYATGFRGDGLEEALGEVAAAALRYGASSYAVYRSPGRQIPASSSSRSFEEYLDWERYWEGPEMTYFRSAHSSWYQVPVLYGWWDLHGRRGDQRRGRRQRERAGERAAVADEG